MASGASGLVGGPLPFAETEASGFQARTFFRATRLDMRLCPSPLCGGFFVERVNRPRTRCADGDSGRECHAAAVDLSALELSPSEESQLLAEVGGRRVLMRGELVLRNVAPGLDVPTLVVEEAWRGMTGTQAKWGIYWGVLPSGIVCITHPCPTLMSMKINGRRVGWLHGMDWSRASATPAQIEAGMEALYSGDGVIGVGRFRKLEGPAGKGVEFVPTEFYLRVPERGDR